MDAAMQIDMSSARPVHRGRKRSIRHRDDIDSEDERWPTIRSTYAEPAESHDHYGMDSAPSKRHRNSVGQAIQRRTGPQKYNAHALLNDLAFTKLYVTANFLNYNPAFSPVVLCIVTQHASLYRALCQVVPSLHDIAPNLQALALATSDMKESLEHDSPDSALIVPISTLSDLSEATRYELQAFVEALPEHDMIVVIDSNETCIWTSAQLPEQDSCPKRGAAWLRRDLKTALIRVLRPCSFGDEMEND